jgi:hypothetical protein
MKSLIDTTEFITKEEYSKFKEKYSMYQAYPLDNFVILSRREDPFFSIYNIAHHFEKKYKKSKLFLLVNRYTDGVTKENIIDFFIFNNVNIFDKSLTSKITIKTDTLGDKQTQVIHMLQMAQKLLDTDSVTVILGSNITEKDIKNLISKDIIKQLYFLKLSSVLKPVKMLEPRPSIMKRFAILAILVIVAFEFTQDGLDMLLDDYKNDIKKETKKLKRSSSVLSQDLKIKQQENIQLVKELKYWNDKAVFKESKKK